MKSWILTLKALFSSTTLRSLHSARQQLLEKNFQQTFSVSIIAAILVVVVGTLLVNSSWVPTDMRDYMTSRNGIFQLPRESYSYITSGMVDADCSLVNECKSVLSNPFLLKEVDLNEIDNMTPVGDRDLTMYLRVTIATWALSQLQDEPNLLISLPQLKYREAELFLGERHLNSFKRGERLTANLNADDVFKHDTITLELALRLAPTERPMAGFRNNEGLFAASQTEFYRYENYLVANSTSGVGKMGRVAKIVLALFCLLLFLVVDRSPESVGLALFMGFEAVAMGIEEGLIPFGSLGLGSEGAIVHFCYQMGDLLKLYFLLQLARIGSPNVLPWLIGGTLLSLPYGLFMEFASSNQWAWIYKLPRSRDTLVGLLGAAVCMRAIFSLRDQRVPWRVTALTVGGVAALTEVVNSWIAHSNVIQVYPEFKTVFTVLQANTGYLFAFSTFLNISHMESRVKLLTKERDKALEMKRQMELGQSVQKAFLTMPSLPPELGIASHHEAAKYVSGDTYFVHYDSARRSVTFLLNDVTGHGVQAALKAFASNMIAKTIWMNDSGDEGVAFERRKPVSRLCRFDKMVDELICRTSDNEIPDFNAMIGAEFFLDTRRLEIYRANYSFPLILEPRFDWSVGAEGEMAPFWKIESAIVPNRELVEMELKPGSIIVFISDGYVLNARDEASLTRHLYRFIENYPGRINAQKIKAAVINWADGEAFHATEDDRTILVFQWDPEAVATLNENETSPLRIA